MKSPNLDKKDSSTSKNIIGFLFCILSSLTCSQIWLSPLLDDYRVGGEGGETSDRLLKKRKPVLWVREGQPSWSFHVLRCIGHKDATMGAKRKVALLALPCFEVHPCAKGMALWYSYSDYAVIEGPYGTHILIMRSSKGLMVLIF